MKKLAAIFLVCMLFPLTACDSDTQSQYDEGYDAGYSEGLDEGYEVGHDEGYDEGYSTGWEEGYDEGWDAGFEDGSGEVYTSNVPLSTDEAPSYYVWTTPGGSKYHKPWCQYISGRNDLTYFTSSSDAASNGFAPCEVCFQ